MQPLPVEFELFAKRTRFYNDVLGTLSIGLVFGALGTDAPRFYAILSMLFVLVLIIRHGKQYERIYALWRELGHPLARTRIVWKFFMVFNIGWGLLGLVACGVLTKNGIIGFS